MRVDLNESISSLVAGAATKLGISPSSFVRMSVYAAARRVLGDKENRKLLGLKEELKEIYGRLRTQWGDDRLFDAAFGEQLKRLGEIASLEEANKFKLEEPWRKPSTGGE